MAAESTSFTYNSAVILDTLKVSWQIYRCANFLALSEYRRETRSCNTQISATLCAALLFVQVAKSHTQIVRGVYILVVSLAQYECLVGL
jgi:hypothetical protein